jgi:hypothetical protein
MKAVELSQELLRSVKTGASSLLLQRELAEKGTDELITELKDPLSRKAFWINTYNAFVQLLIEKHTPDLLNRKARISFFGARSIPVAGILLSLNDIEHGMLRHSSVWWSLGYLQKIKVSDFEKKLRLPLDYRIHFALNCGAASCPAIAFYKTANLDEQLDNAMVAFLEGTVRFEARSKTVYLSSIFKWYYHDFGGRRGIINLFWRLHLIPADGKIRIRYSAYNWKLLAGKFQQ